MVQSFYTLIVYVRLSRYRGNIDNQGLFLSSAATPLFFTSLLDLAPKTKPPRYPPIKIDRLLGLHSDTDYYT